MLKNIIINVANEKDIVTDVCHVLANSASEKSSGSVRIPSISKSKNKMIERKISCVIGLRRDTDDVNKLLMLGEATKGNGALRETRTNAALERFENIDSPRDPEEQQPLAFVHCI